MSTRVMPRCTIDAGEVHDVLYPFVSLGADKFPREVTANDCLRYLDRWKGAAASTLASTFP
jgi:hypothetical protein